jgi:hypothetical protein
MTNDMTLGRRAAAYLAATIGGLVLALALLPGDAPATPLDRELRSVLENGAPGGKQISRNRIHWPRAGVTLTLTRSNKANGYWRCVKGKVCLFEHSDGFGRIIWFDRPGQHWLAAYGMAPNPRKGKGASSYMNRRRNAATLKGPNFRHNMSNDGRGHNIPRSINDRASYVQLCC